MLISLVVFAAVIQMFGAGIYIRDTLRGRTKPNRVTWFLWAAAPLIATAIIVVEGKLNWTALPVFMAGFVPALIFAASFFNANAYWRLGRFDYACGALGLISLAMWVAVSQPIIAFIMLMATDGLAALPTIRKAWTNPETETGAPYAAALFGGLAGVANVQNWVTLEYAFPLYLVAVNIAVLFAIYRKRVPAVSGA